MKKENIFFLGKRKSEEEEMLKTEKEKQEKYLEKENIWSGKEKKNGEGR